MEGKGKKVAERKAMERWKEKGRKLMARLLFPRNLKLYEN